MHFAAACARGKRVVFCKHIAAKVQQQQEQEQVQQQATWLLLAVAAECVAAAGCALPELCA
jgi:hypothetical protein